MTLMEKDFYKFLVSIGYSTYKASAYKFYLNRFMIENGFDNLVDLADNVFELLNQTIYNYNEIDKKTLEAVLCYKDVLTLFNSFLFNITYPRKFIVCNRKSTKDILYLTTNQPYIPGCQPRALIDIDSHTGKPTDKQWFGIPEVANALHIDEKVLKRWSNLPESERKAKYIPNRYKGKVSDDIDLSWNGTANGEFGFYYYTLNELNDFLEYQFDYGKGNKREWYLSDIDIRKQK